MKSRVLELNSSDERGINVIREKVKTFAQFTPSGHRTE
jgi:replication factor C subunit 2/4